MKKTQTHAEQECIRKENEKRVQEVKGKKVEKKGKQGKDKAYKAEGEKIKRMRNGLRALKEI